MHWEIFFSQPITQFSSVVALFLGLHKAGILDVRVLVRSMLGMVESGQVHPEVDASLQLLHSQMAELAQYFNHDTTQRYTDIQETLRAIERGQGTTNEMLRGMKDYGIKVLKD